MKKEIKTLQQLYREEQFKYIDSDDDPQAEMSDFIYPDGVFAELKNNLIVFISDKEIQTFFPFPYSASISGDYEKKLEEASKTVTLDYAISINTEWVDFILNCLRTKPDMEKGALYLVREDQRLPNDSRFRSVKFFKSYPDMFYIGANEKDNMVLLTDVDDRKKLYSAYKKARKRIVDSVTEWYEKYKDNAFDIIMYNQE